MESESLQNITCKFGGTSLADADNIRRAMAIIQADPRRRFIVPSAPGKRHANDTKITDLLSVWHGHLVDEESASDVRDKLAGRYGELAQSLGVDFHVDHYLDEIAEEFDEDGGWDYVVSRGEYLNGLLLSRLLGAQFVSPRKHILLRRDGTVDPETYTRLRRVLTGTGRFVVPGFYGALRDGTVKTFPRGGSDISGAIVARATNSVVYENWTDTSGFRMADPRIVPRAARMAEVTYKELRELAYMGANVFHEEAVFPVQTAGIPIEIRNTHAPDAPGTTILAQRQAKEPVTGIAGLRGFSMVNAAKTLMNKERRFLQHMLRVLDEHDVVVEHVATGIDAVSLAVKTEELTGKTEDIRRGIAAACAPDELSFEEGYSMIATVGQGMEGRVGMAARLCGALARESIGIHVIDQGSIENNIIVGVRESDHDNAIRAIYREFAEPARQTDPIKEEALV